MGTLLVGAIVFAAIGFAGYKVFKDYKNKKGCGCGCDSCGSCPNYTD